MRIQLNNIKTSEEVKVNETINSSKIPLGENASLASPVRIKGVLRYAGSDEVYFEGTVFAKVRLTCVRCLEEFEQNFEIPFSESYVPAQFANVNPVKENRELEELDVLTYNGVFIDTVEIARQILIQYMPPYPLCPKCRAETA